MSVGATQVPAQSGVRPPSLAAAWGWCGLAAGLTMLGMSMGPGQGGSVALLVITLVVVVLGLATTVRAILQAVRVLRDDRLLAVVPLVADLLLLMWGLIAVLGTFGRFYGWG